MDDIYKTGCAQFDASFSFLTGDVCWEDHGGTWVRKVSDSRFHVAQIFNWEESVGSEGEGMGYNVSLREVDTDDADRYHPSLKSCGYEMEKDGTIYVPCTGDVLCEANDEKARKLILCECMNGYGAYAPLEEFNGEDFLELFAQAAALSNELVEDNEAYEARMNRPVNRLGSTAREYQKGDLDSAMMRGLVKEDSRAELWAKLRCGEENLESLKELAHLMHDEGEV